MTLADAQQALEEAEARDGHRLAIMQREMRGRLPQTRRGTIPDVVGEGRFGAYYDVLVRLAGLDEAEVTTVYADLVRENPQLDPIHICVLFVAGERFRANYRKWIDHLVIGTVDPRVCHVALAAMILGTADALRITLGLPQDARDGLPSKEVP